MAWTTPKTWTAETLEVADMNTYIRDNQLALKSPPSDVVDINDTADYTNTGSWVLVDANFVLTPTTAGGDVVVWLTCTVTCSAAARIYFRLLVNSVAEPADDGLCHQYIGASGQEQVVSFVYVVQGLSAATQDIRLQWRRDAGTATMFAGAGTSGDDVHPQFGCAELL